MLSVIIIGVGGWVTRVQYFFDVSFVTDCRQLFDVFIISFGCECVYVACVRVWVCVCAFYHIGCLTTCFYCTTCINVFSSF